MSSSHTTNPRPQPAAVAEQSGDAVMATIFAPTGPERLRALESAHPRVRRAVEQLERQGPPTHVDPEEGPRIWNYRHDVPLHINHPGGSRHTCNVFARDVGPSGMSFIHGGFLHTGTVVEVILPRRDARVPTQIETHGAGADDGSDVALAHQRMPIQTVVAIVSSCRHIDGVHHLVQVRWRERLRVETCVDPTRWEAAGAMRMSPTGRQGRVLVVGDTGATLFLLQKRLAQAALNVRGVKGLVAALRLLKSEGGDFDVLLIDLDLPDTDAEGQFTTVGQVVSQLRRAGFERALVAASAEPEGEAARQALRVGVAAVVAKPYRFDSLVQTLSNLISGQLLEQEREEPVCSALWESADIAPLLPEYLAEVEEMCKRLEKAWESRDAAGARRACLWFKGTGETYGYAVLTLAGDEAAAALAAGKSLGCAELPLQELLHLCRRLVVSPGSSPGRRPAAATDNRPAPASHAA